MNGNDEAATGGEDRRRAAIGPRASYYLAKWSEMDSKGIKRSWNWPACFVNLFWFAYRKMWLPLIVFLVAAAALGFATAGARMDVQLLPMIALSFVTGTYGNFLYRRHVERLVAGTAGMDEEAVLERLRKRGGTSPLALGIALALAAAGAAALVVQQAQQIGSAAQRPA